MRRFLLLFACSLLLACGDDDGGADDPAVDGGPAVDAGRGDGGSEPADAGSEPDDGGSDPVDGGPAGDDAGPADAFTEADLGASPCPGSLFGSPCTESCSRGYECVDGACMPSMTSRESCGGFAGARCTTRAFPNCLFYAGSDFGPCLSEEELACACRSSLAERFQCDTRP